MKIHSKNNLELSLKQNIKLSQDYSKLPEYLLFLPEPDVWLCGVILSRVHIKVKLYVKQPFSSILC